MSLLLTLRLILKPLWSVWLALSAHIVCVCDYVCVYALAGVKSGSGKERHMSSNEIKWMSCLPGLNRIKCCTNQPVEPNQDSTLHPSCSTMGTGVCWFCYSEDNTWVVVPWGTFSYKKKKIHKVRNIKLSGAKVTIMASLNKMWLQKNSKTGLCLQTELRVYMDKGMWEMGPEVRAAPIKLSANLGREYWVHRARDRQRWSSLKRWGRTLTHRSCITKQCVHVTLVFSHPFCF